MRLLSLLVSSSLLKRLLELIKCVKVEEFSLEGEYMLFSLFIFLIFMLDIDVDNNELNIFIFL